MQKRKKIELNKRKSKHKSNEHDHTPLDGSNQANPLSPFLNIDDHDDTHMDSKKKLNSNATSSLTKSNLKFDQNHIDEYDQAIVVNKNDDEEKQLLCKLCERNLPVFLTRDDNQILRMPESSLVPFLKNLKNDYLKNRAYLKFLKVNSKFI